MPDLWSGFLFLHISNGEYGEYGESTFYNFILASSGFFSLPIHLLLFFIPIPKIIYRNLIHLIHQFTTTNKKPRRLAGHKHIEQATG